MYVSAVGRKSSISKSGFLVFPSWKTPRQNARRQGGGGLVRQTAHKSERARQPNQPKPTQTRLTGFLVVAPGGVVEEDRVEDARLADALVDAAALLRGVALLEQAPVDEDVGVLGLLSSTHDGKKKKIS